MILLRSLTVELQPEREDAARWYQSQATDLQFCEGEGGRIPMGVRIRPFWALERERTGL